MPDNGPAQPTIGEPRRPSPAAGWRWTRMSALVVVLAVWAGIYLPSLGVGEFKGEEARRVLPAVSMLQSGNWIVPTIGGEWYYNKPPFINWVVAASFAITSEQSEWSARLVSALFVLLFAAQLIAGRGTWLPLRARLAAAAAFMTSVCMIEKGRLIEIEAVYVCLTGFAVLWWLECFAACRSRWLMWLPPAAPLACGMLTKGPFILGVYYLVVLAALLYSRRLKQILCPQHILALAIVVAISGGWAYLASQQADAEAMASRMSGQFLSRLIPGRIDWAYWAGNVADSFRNLLPWLLVMPILWMKRITSRIDPADLPIYKAIRLAFVVGFIALNALPGTEARYTMPVYPLAAIVLGWALTRDDEPMATDRIWLGALLGGFILACAALAAGMIFLGGSGGGLLMLIAGACIAAALVQNRSVFRTRYQLTLLTAALVVAVMLIYGLFTPAMSEGRQKRRAAAGLLNEQAPPEQTLYAFKPGYQAFLFYVRQPLGYITDVEDIDADVRYLLVRESARDDVLRRLTDEGVRHKTVCEFRYRHKGRFYLLKLSAAGPSTAPDAPAATGPAG